MTEENSMSNWFQDNLRIIISVGIVILLVFAIYSYSKRNSATDVIVDDSQIEEVAMTASDIENDEINEIIDEIKDEELNKDVSVTIEQEEPVNNKTQEADNTEAKIALEKKMAEEAKKAAAAKKVKEEQQRKQQAEQEAKLALENKLKEEAAKKETALALDKKMKEEAEKQENNNKAAKDVVKEVIESRSRQQKEGVIVVVAVSGDSKTTLARKSAAEYIAKNNVSGLTPAHKIYIEDYVQKATRSNGIHTGTEMEFSNNLIAQAIEISRTLSSAQLSNLDKYTANVSTL